MEVAAMSARECERELAKALSVLREHDVAPGSIGMCRCGRTWSCSVADAAAAYAAGLEARLALLGPTMLLPVVRG